MDKRQLIDEIRHFNTSVAPEFLLQFDEDQLSQYLEHLQNASRKNIRIAAWVRRGEQKQWMKLAS